MWWWYSRPIDEPTTSADVVTVTAPPGVLSAAAASVQLDFASEPRDESLCGRRAGVWASQGSHGTMWWWDSRLIHEPTTSADTVVVYRSPTVDETALESRGERSLGGPLHYHGVG